MTTIGVPEVGSPDWRVVYPVPPRLRLEIGPWCPIDDAALAVERYGWLCPQCLAWWDRTGGNPTWADAPAVAGDLMHPVDLDLPVAPWWRTRPAMAAAGIGGLLVTGGGYAAGRALRPYADLVPDALLWAVSLIVVGLLLPGAGLLLGWRWWTSHTGGGAA